MNLGILRLTPEALEASGSLRSAVESGKDALAERLEYLTEFLGGSFKREGMYPAWEYKADSPLRDLMVETYTELFGKEPVVEMIHAGLECGLFYERIPGIDCISFGPQMHNVHTVSERLSVSSAERMWNFLTEVLKKLAERVCRQTVPGASSCLPFFIKDVPPVFPVLSSLACA